VFAKKLLNNAVFYILWYAKNINNLKYHNLFVKKDYQWFADSAGAHLWAEDKFTKKIVRPTPEERKNIDVFLNKNPNLELYRILGLNVQGVEKAQGYEFNGRIYYPPKGTQWKTSFPEGLDRLKAKNRIQAENTALGVKLYYKDYPIMIMNNLWDKIGAVNEKIYVVQTSNELPKRCILMTTDPGDLVLDITCGSGTTAYVAEQWGRRWITCDTSRVSIALAKKRLMTATFDYYKLAYPKQGVGSGFVYKTAPHITLGSIANDEPPAQEILYDQPEIDKSKMRISGPFTVEALPAPTVKPLDELYIIQEDISIKQAEWREELLATGILARNGKKIEFSRVEPLSGTKYLQAEAETKENPPRRAVICFAGETKPMDARIVALAIEEAETQKPTPKLILFSAFQFDPEAAKTIDETNWPGGIFVELPLVNAIRERVKLWRKNNYPGITGVTKKLLEHWNDNEARQYPFFFCQLDAIETLIWLTEAPVAEKAGIEIEGDGGAFKRICTKLCTGGGKTIVMAMLIAWQVCNKAAYPQDKRFSKNVFIVAPGLTVKSRLKVLEIGGADNYYKQFNILPYGLEEKLNQGRILIKNWQALAWENEDAIKKRKSVDKRGAKSDEAYTREVLEQMANASNILVINDEAHHAWRKNPEIKIKLVGIDKKEYKEAEQQATIWVGGLDRIHNTRKILTCYDFSATPFAPSGKRNAEEALFSWIVSDFGLNDGIESGLVKTPRVVVRDDVLPDTQTFKSKLYHIYNDEIVKDDINRSAKPEEALPDLIHQAYCLLGADWLETYKSWREAGSQVPPVMITVANRTETAARIEYAFKHRKIPIVELSDEKFTLRIDSKIMEYAEDVDTDRINEDNEENKNLSKKAITAILRETVDTVGKVGKRGEQIRNIISVGMLSEGWDAKTVTHIMGLRAFTSQLLCEQVVGRGLRRTSYEMEEGSKLFSAEYVNIFGIPFSYLPCEDDDKGKPIVTKPKTQIETLKEKSEYAIYWPNVIRIDRIFKPKLSIDINNIDTLIIERSETRLSAELAPIVDGKTDLMKCNEIDLQKLHAHKRMQTIIFNVISSIYEQMNAEWQSKGTKLSLMGQLFDLVENYMKTGGIAIEPPMLNLDDKRKRIIYMMNMNKIVKHLWKYIKVQQTEKILPVLDTNKKIRSTGDMVTWYTSKPCQITQKSHISHCVYDSTWETTASYKLDKNPNVAAWAKSDHLGFEIIYVYGGVVRKYYPDFLIKLRNNIMLILETKGKERGRDKEKKAALDEWVKAVNGLEEFGIWFNDVCYDVGDVDAIIEKYIK